MKLQQITVETNRDGAMNSADDSLVEKVWHDLDGQVSREQVSQVVAEVAVGFQNASIKAFVPIFVHKLALERLKRLRNDKSHPAADRVPVNGRQHHG